MSGFWGALVFNLVVLAIVGFITAGLLYESKNGHSSKDGHKRKRKHSH